MNPLLIVVLLLLLFWFISAGNVSESFFYYKRKKDAKKPTAYFPKGVPINHSDLARKYPERMFADPDWAYGQCASAGGGARC